MHAQSSSDELLALFDRRIALIDGAMGTCLQELRPTCDDFGGPAREGCNEALLLTRPDLVADVHARYFEAGADIVETNTFGGTPLVLAEYGLAERCREINRLGAQVARQVAERFSTRDRPRFVAGSMGPTTCALSVNRTCDFEALVDHYFEQAWGLHEGGIDYFLVETCQDTLNLKAALIAIERLFERGFLRLPIAVSATLDTTGHMLGGQSPEVLGRTLAPFDLLYLGLNCGAGVELLAPQLSALAGATQARLALMPNAGLPDEEGHYGQTPEDFARAIEAACGQGLLNLVGGCCGTTPAHIRALASALPHLTPRRLPSPPASGRAGISWLTGIDAVAIGDSPRPAIAGERSNALGSKKFRDLIGADDFDAAADFARRQIAEGAQLIDVAVQQAERDEAEDMDRLLACLAPRIRAPLMIDTTNPEVAERALGHCQGKAIVNSANLEAGEARFLDMARVARRFGAALVVGLIDEGGMAVDLARKLEIAARAIAHLEALGFHRGDLYIDTLVFPCASADPAYAGAARETVKAICEIKRRFPGIRTALGISNISFGLPPAGRALVSALFFESCAKAGLDLAIANAASLGRGGGLQPPEIAASARALLEIERGAPDAIARWQSCIADLTARLRAHTAAAPIGRTADDKAADRLSPEARIERCIAKGSKDGLFEALDAAMAQGIRAMDLVNGALMRGMDEVGRRFNAGDRIVVEVLQSAEVMKSAITHLEPRMGLGESAIHRGRLLLATVKGDVHDIGKNLVSMIFSSNGFEVVDLGIKVEDEAIVSAAIAHAPDVIGLSGLLVKSALQMIETAKALAAAGVHCPLMVGGAALSPSFVEQKLQPAYPGLALYARDAMHGLSLAKKIVGSGVDRGQLGARQQGRTGPVRTPRAARPPPSPPARPVSETLGERCEIPQPPDFERHVTAIDLREIWALLNQAMLYGHHLGLRGDFIGHIDEMKAADLAARSERALALRQQIECLKQTLALRDLRPHAVHRFVRAERRGDDLLLRADGAEWSLPFPRIDGRSLADHVAGATSGKEDAIALFAVTAGQEILEISADFRARGELINAHLLQALALSVAEAGAEWVHAHIRSRWGLEAPLSMPDVAARRALLAGQYRGGRFSPGYRACPDLGLQQVLFEILRPRDIGIELTESWMMHPEASVSAFVFHHPAAGRHHRP